MATQTLLNLASRQYSAATTTSPMYTVPAGVSTVTAAFTVASPDVSDPTKTMTFECDRFDTVSQSWVFDHGFQWQGGGVDKLGNPASPSMTVDGLSQGTQLRIVITINAPLTTAIVVTAQ